CRCAYRQKRRGHVAELIAVRARITLDGTLMYAANQRRGQHNSVELTGSSGLTPPVAVEKCHRSTGRLESVPDVLGDLLSLAVAGSVEDENAPLCHTCLRISAFCTDFSAERGAVGRPPVLPV